MISQDGTGLRVLAPVSEGDASAANNAASVAFGIVPAEANHLTELLGRLDLDQRDVVCLAEGADELLVPILGAITAQKATEGSATIEGTDGLAEATLNAIPGDGVLEDDLDGIIQRQHLLLRGGGDRGVGGGFRDRGGGFVVRHSSVVFFLTSDYLNSQVD